MPVTRQQRKACSQSAARALADDTDATRIDSQRLGVGREPDQRSVAVFEPRRMRMLGSKAIVHGQDDAAGGTCQIDIAGGIHLRAAHDEAATMNVQQGPAGCVLRLEEQAANALRGHLLDADVDMGDGIGLDRQVHHRGAKSGQRFGTKVDGRERFHQWPERRVHVLLVRCLPGVSSGYRVRR